jgi:hypothetical protein
MGERLAAYGQFTGHRLVTLPRRRRLFAAFLVYKSVQFHAPKAALKIQLPKHVARNAQASARSTYSMF